MVECNHDWAYITDNEDRWNGDERRFCHKCMTMQRRDLRGAVWTDDLSSPELRAALDERLAMAYELGRGHYPLDECVVMALCKAKTKRQESE